MANSSKPVKPGSADIPQPQIQGAQPNLRHRVGNPKPLDPKVWKTPGQQALEKGLQQVFGHDPKGTTPKLPKGVNMSLRGSTTTVAAPTSVKVADKKKKKKKKAKPKKPRASSRGY